MDGLISEDRDEHHHNTWEDFLFVNYGGRD